MKRKLLLIFFTLTALQGHSQTFQWVKRMIWADGIMTQNPVAVDSIGNVYTSGSYFGSQDLDPGPDTFLLSNGGSGYPEAYLQKLDSNGNFLWAGRMGGYDIREEPKAITVDRQGNIFSAGRFKGVYGIADFDPEPDTCAVNHPGSDFSIYLSKLDPDGHCVFAGSIEPTYDSSPFGVTSDDGGNLYMCGEFTGQADFDPGAGVITMTSPTFSFTDAFIVKMDPLGNAAWAKRLGGPGNDAATSIAVDDSGNVYVTGYFTRTVDFDPGPGTLNITAVDDSDIFVCKLNTAGDLVWARTMGGMYYDVGYSVAVDGEGNVYTTGYFQMTVDFDPGPDSMNLVSTGRSVYVQKMNSSGELRWAKMLGGGNGEAHSLALNGAGEMAVVGYFSLAGDFDPGPGVATLTPVASSDVFFAQLDTAGNFVWAKSIGELVVRIGHHYRGKRKFHLYSRKLLRNRRLRRRPWSDHDDRSFRILPG